MITEEIQKRIAVIKDSEWDYEVAHGLEDKLREDFIRYVATLEIPTLAEKAKLILSTEDIDFPRYCA